MCPPDLRRIPLYLLTILLLCQATLSAAAEGRFIVDQDAKILAFGDSLTYGIGGSGKDYPQHLQQLLKAEVINAGSPGDTASSGAERFARALQEAQPGLVILCLGINDFYRNTPDTVIRQGLSHILETSRQASVPVLLVAVSKPGQNQAHPLYAELAVQYEAYLDASSLVKVMNNPGFKADPVHLNNEGYQQLASAIAARIRTLGRSD